MSMLDQTSGISVLRHPPFAFYLSARVLSTIALQILNVAIGWQVYDLTGDLLDLGLVGLAQFAPFLLLILVAGQLADRYDRRRILNACFAVQLTAALLLLHFTLSGQLRVEIIFAIATLLGIARAFAMPASQAILMNLVPVSRYANAMALSSSTFHAAVILGPVAGGLLYVFGSSVAYGVSVALLAFASLLMLLVSSNQQVSRREPASWNTLLEGLRFVWSRPVVLGAISLDLFAVLFGGVTALLPAFAKDVLDVGPTGLGLLRSAPAIGAVVVSTWLAFHPITRHVGRWMFGGVALFGAATIVFGLSTSATLSFIALLLVGGGDMVSVYIRHLLVQLETPDDIRGRVSAVNAVFIGASNELGEFESGVTARLMGLVPAVVFGGAATLAVTLAWMQRFPVLREMDRLPSPNQARHEPSAITTEDIAIEGAVK